ncbi:hypothetical protein DPMN_160717 [Dreissena polymorpha]|uniref:Peptidase A2 domain-containing protein n=1 Tax=Dreissena polymorpha TaxID=45954 RepID=A0A9D4IRY6_DREPO|nr:hypothetical protein DPMN_160717 [Dreissena polymorpha]
MDRRLGGKGGEVKKSTFNVTGLFFVTAHIDGSSVSCLIDTGATLSLMSTKTWSLNRGKCTDLKSFDKDIFAACGTPLTIKRQTTVDLRINGKTYPITTVIAYIDGEIMLDLDFSSSISVILTWHQSRYLLMETGVLSKAKELQDARLAIRRRMISI